MLTRLFWEKKKKLFSQSVSQSLKRYVKRVTMLTFSGSTLKLKTKFTDFESSICSFKALKDRQILNAENKNLPQPHKAKTSTVTCW